MGATQSTPKIAQRFDDKLTKQDVFKMLDKFVGDNGPGDSYLGSFIDTWNKRKESRQRALSAKSSLILRGHRFIMCNKSTNLSIVLGSNCTRLYIIQKSNKRWLCYIIGGLTVAEVNGLKSKWKNEHMKKKCGGGAR